MKNEVSVLALMKNVIGNSLGGFIHLAGEKFDSSREGYIRHCQTRALLYRQLAKFCIEQADAYDEHVAELTPPRLVVTATEFPTPHLVVTTTEEEPPSPT